MNKRRLDAYENSAVEHKSPFKPWASMDVPEHPKDRYLQPFAGDRITWAESNQVPGWQEDEKLVAIDGYRMKRLPSKDILVGYMNAKAADPNTDFKDFVRHARDVKYEEKYKHPRQPSGIQAVGKKVGELWPAVMDKYSEIKEAEKTDKRGKKKHVFKRFLKEQYGGGELPRTLFSRVNGAIYNLVASTVYQNAPYNGRPIAPTKENKQAFSQAIAQAAQQISGPTVDAEVAKALKR
jgi:hypothetical protein